MDRIFYPSATTDPVTGLPVYILDSHFLPSTNTINYDDFLPALLGNLPNSPNSKYCLVFFSGALSSNEHISWVYGIRFFKELTRLQMLSCARIYVVHESWWIKTVANLLGNLNAVNTPSRWLPSFGKKPVDEGSDESLVVHCDSLGHLSEWMNVCKLKISLPVYRHDLVACTPHLNDSLMNLPSSIQNEYGLIIGGPLDYTPDGKPLNLSAFHFDSLFTILRQNVALIRSSPNFFHHPGNKSANKVLYDCINRNQLFNINDWDLYNIGFIFKKFLQFHDLGHPLLPLQCIEEPSLMTNPEYIRRVYAAITASCPRNARLYSQLIPFFREVVSYTFDLDEAGDDGETPPETAHTRYSIAKAFSLVFTLESYNARESIFKATDYLSSLIQFWDEVYTDEESPLPRSTTTISPPLCLETSSSHPVAERPLPSPLSLSAPPHRQSPLTSSFGLLPDSGVSLVDSGAWRARPLQPASSLSLPTLPNDSYDTNYEASLDPKKKQPAVSEALVNHKRNLKPQLVTKKPSFRSVSSESPIVVPAPLVAQGRKVSLLARIYEERLQGLKEMSR